jgi:hypothetical protein
MTAFQVNVKIDAKQLRPVPEELYDVLGQEGLPRERLAVYKLRPVTL